MSLVDLVLEVHDALAEHRLSHAFGGALALAYVTDPRGTVDIDVNVFSPVERLDPVLGALGALGLQPVQDREAWVPSAGLRLRRPSDPFPVDVFPSLDEHYREVERRRVRHPFGPARRSLPFLSAEDLTVFKLSFGRDKDWVDLRAIAGARPGLDMDYVERQLLALRGPSMYPRLARLRSMLR